MKHLVYMLITILLLVSLGAQAAKRSHRGQHAPQQRVNLQVDKKTKDKLVAALEKERVALLNRYKQRELHTQSLREKNKSLVASVSKLENELETAAIRQQAIQA